MHCVRDSSNQLGTKEHQAVLPTAFAGGCRVLPKVMGSLLLLFFVAVGTTCFVLRYAHAHTYTPHGHWPVRVQVCSVLLCTRRVTLKNTGTT